MNLANMKVDKRVAMINQNVTKAMARRLRSAIPEQLADTLLTHHSNPVAFFDAHVSFFCFNK